MKRYGSLPFLFEEEKDLVEKLVGKRVKLSKNHCTL